MKLVDRFRVLTYNIGFISKGIGMVLNDGIISDDIVWLKHNYRDRFFADPFLFRVDEDYFYVLCEEFIFWEEKGKITVLKVRKKDFSLKGKYVLIEEETHLSFPFCELNGEWVVPESCKSGRTCAYRIVNQNGILKVVEKKLIVDEGLVDNVYVKDDDGNIWLYTGKTRIPSTELYEYRLGNDGKFLATSEIPIECSNRTTRGAGKFFRYNDELYRPVQDCKGRYGRQTKILKIESFGSCGYKYKEYQTLNSFRNPPYDETMHTFNVYDEIIIVDGSKDFLRFPMKFFYKKCRWLCKLIFRL